MRTQLLIIALVMLGCTEEDIPTVNIRVDHFQQTAVGVGPTLVYRVQKGDSINTDTWSYLYGDIEGFSYELGYVYDLEVEEVLVANPPADGSSVRYVLKQLIAKEPVASTVTFEIRVKSVARSSPPSYVTGNAADGYEILSIVPIVCDTLCKKLEKYLTTEDEVVGIFTHAPNETIRLTGLETD